MVWDASDFCSNGITLWSFAATPRSEKELNKYNLLRILSLEQSNRHFAYLIFKLFLPSHLLHIVMEIAGLILGLRPANERRRYFVTTSWETVLLCNDDSHWLGAKLESALKLYCRYFFNRYYWPAVVMGAVVRRQQVYREQRKKDNITNILCRSLAPFSWNWMIPMPYHTISFIKTCKIDQMLECENIWRFIQGFLLFYSIFGLGNTWVFFLCT